MPRVVNLVLKYQEMLRLSKIFFLLLLILPSVVSAKILWLEKNYDFGLMKEEAGPARGEVRFINNGPEPVVITGARPSCGCTSVEYPESPIAPGDTAIISFAYDPKARPGKFDKNIKVYIGENDSYKINITGNVLGLPESLRPLYPHEVGDLRISDTAVDAGKMTAGNSRNFFIRCYNQSLDSISPVPLSNNPALNVKFSEPKMGPGDVAVIAIFFDTSKVNEVGEVEIPFTISSNSADINAPKQEITFHAEIAPDFSKMSPEQVDNAPRCYLVPDRLDVGIISGATSISLSFLIQNQGKSEMEVMRILPKSDAIKIKRKPSSIKSKKTAECRLSLSTGIIPEGPFNLPIEIYTNDPLHPVRTLSLVGIKE